MKWRVQLSKPAGKDLERLDAAVREKVVKALGRFALEGQGDVKAMKPFTGEYRLRVGEYRVRFALDHAREEMVVLHVAHRREVYR